MGATKCFTCIFKKAAISAVACGAFLLPAVHPEVPPAFAAHPAPVPLASAPTHDVGDPSHVPEPDPFMAAPTSLHSVTASPPESGVPVVTWESLTKRARPARRSSASSAPTPGRPCRIAPDAPST
jgi:hypothetical protein